MSAGRVNGVVCEDGTTIDADRVVLAAGRGTEALAASAGVSVPMTTTPGLILHTEPLSPLFTRMILASWLHVRQQTDGTILAATDFGGGEVNDDPERGAGVLLDLLRKNVRGCEHARIGRTTLGWRPLPADGFPIVGAPADACGLYVVTSHSGATLAPALGLFAAREIVEGVRDPMLAPYGPDRFARATAA
jgi:glycine/D-amino acid oxidase-like deaminating enzyme